MVTLRCTQKLLRRLHVSPQAAHAPSTTVLGDWYANLYYSRPQYILCMNERTLLLVLVPARDAKSLGPRFRDAAVAHLRRIGIPDAAIAAEARAMSEIAFGRTTSRSVLGCLREAAFALSFERENPRFSSIEDLQMYFAQYIYSTTGYRYPGELALELFGTAAATAGAVRPRIH